MNPVYFPFTFIPESIAEKINSLFGLPIVYQPLFKTVPDEMRRMEHDQLIDIKIPIKEDDERLIQFSSEFKEWGRLHYGDRISLKSLFKKGFYNTTFAAQISADILKGGQSENPDLDAVFLARLFLLMAQELDMQQSDIDHELALSINDELNLFKSMTGEERALDISKGSLFDKDYGAYMTDQRIAAWLMVMQQDKFVPSFLLTTSKAVFNEISADGDLEDVCFFESISLDQPASFKEEMASFLMNLIGEPWRGAENISCPGYESGGMNPINFRLGVLPGMRPDAMIKNTVKNDETLNHKHLSLNTVIGLFNDF